MWGDFVYKFPENLYTDVRIEDVFETNITFTLGKITEYKIRNYKAGFIRVFDGERWYYGSTSSLEQIQDEIEKLSKMAKPNEKIGENPIVKRFEVNSGEFFKFKDEDVSKISEEDKLNLLKDMFPVITANKYVKNWNARYVDCRKVKEFYSSKGSNLKFDIQRCGFSMGFSMAEGEKNFSEAYQIGTSSFGNLKNKNKEFKEHVDKSEKFLLNAKPIEKGKYTVILSPVAAGVFAHESFGHKSEADFMIGDETMKKEWAMGKKVGSDILTIVDDGNVLGSGYTPFDDEGSKAKKTYLIKDGVLEGRLHSGTTASMLEEELTGNSRSMNFEFEPIVRMTTTYIGSGNETKEELIGKVKHGIYVETIKHGSGMSTFTLAPSLAYMIRDGKIAEPVNISVVTGNVFETLSEIDGLSNEIELLSFVMGGCGKMEQFPLPVGFGGPYVRVKNLNVQ